MVLTVFPVQQSIHRDTKVMSFSLLIGTGQEPLHLESRMLKSWLFKWTSYGMYKSITYKINFKCFLKGILLIFCKLQVDLGVELWWRWWDWVRIRRTNAIHIQEGRLAQGRTWKQIVGRICGWDREPPFLWSR